MRVETSRLGLQYFLGSAYAWQGYKANDMGPNHTVPMELALKVADKIRAREPFTVYVVLPMWSEGGLLISLFLSLPLPPPLSLSLSLSLSLLFVSPFLRACVCVCVCVCVNVCCVRVCVHVCLCTPFLQAVSKHRRVAGADEHEHCWLAFVISSVVPLDLCYMFVVLYPAKPLNLAA
jgi:hypothetical protein